MKRGTLGAFLGLMVAMLVATLDTQVVATALPTVVRELGGIDLFAWVGTAYLLAFTAATPLYGRLGDVLGRKRVFLASLVLFLLGSAACGAATSMGQLVASRALQGIGGGGLSVSLFALLADLFDARARARYMGYATAVFTVSGLAGPVLGGLVTTHVGWRWVFYLNLPLGLLALALTAKLLAPDRRREDRPRIDLAGTAALAILAAAVVLLGNWAGTRFPLASPPTLGLAAIATAAAIAWVVASRRTEAPAIPPRLFRDRTFAVANGLGLIGGMVSLGAVTYVALYLQTVAGASPQSGGLLMLPSTVGTLIAATVSGQLVARTGRYRWYPAASMAVATAAALLLATMTPATPLATAVLYLTLFGAGLGLSQQIIMLAAQSSAPPADLGAATAAVTFTRMLGSTIGIALFGGILTARLTAHLTPDAYAHALRGVFLAAAAAALLGLLLAMLLPDVHLAGGAGQGSDRVPKKE